MSEKSQTLEKKQKRFQNEVLSFNRLFASSPRNLEETMRMSISSIYEQLSENQRQCLPESHQLKVLHDGTQYSLFLRHLVEQQICSTTNDPLIKTELDTWVIDMLKGISLSDIKFVLTSTSRNSSAVSRHNTVKRELLRFCQLLLYSGSTLVSEELMQTIGEEQNIKIIIDDDELPKNQASMLRLHDEDCNFFHRLTRLFQMKILLSMIKMDMHHF